ncbi:MAG: IS3 family transposase [Candidatus Hodarchaeota archaeon]
MFKFLVHKGQLVFSEEHLRRIFREYVKYYNNDRCHLTLDRNTPKGRAVRQKPLKAAKVIQMKFHSWFVYNRFMSCSDSIYQQ